MTDPQIEKLAKGLTKAQRDAVLLRPRGYPEDHCYAHHLGTYNRLRTLGLAERVSSNVVLRLTPLGLALRAHIAKENGHD